MFSTAASVLPDRPYAVAAQGEARARLALPTPTFVPLKASPDQAARLPPSEQPEQEQQPGMVAENDDQLHLRRRKELNVATRERPYELQPWLDLAQLEDGRSYCTWQHCHASTL